MCTTDASSPRVGISACLLGEPVRYDGGHKRDPYLAEELSRHVEWVPVCPEVELGLGTPRAPISLVAGEAGVRLVAATGDHDLTEAMASYVARRLDELEPLGLCGYVFKSRSPSCGVTSTPIHGRNGSVLEYSAGQFAAAVRARWPELPVVEETGLQDPGTREEFLARVIQRHHAERGT